MTLSGAAADKRLAMSANQKQALVHIYNIVTGSAASVNLDAKFKSEVTKPRNN
jgi:molybdopterin-containing oxidoreductase family iron-sulfur binding subunit